MRVTLHLMRRAPSREWPFDCIHIARSYIESRLGISSTIRSIPRDTLLPAHHLSTSACASSDSDTAANLLDDLVNYERSGIPPAAGTAGSLRFDLGRMHRLLAALGNPHLGVKAVHVAGSKGGSPARTGTAARGYGIGRPRPVPCSSFRRIRFPHLGHVDPLL